MEFNFCEKQYATIRQTAQIVGVPSDRIRAWVKQGKVKGFYSGSRFYVNVAQLQEALERGDFATPAPTQTERDEDGSGGEGGTPHETN